MILFLAARIVLIWCFAQADAACEGKSSNKYTWFDSICEFRRGYFMVSHYSIVLLVEYRVSNLKQLMINLPLNMSVHHKFMHVSHTYSPCLIHCTLILNRFAC